MKNMMKRVVVSAMLLVVAGVTSAQIGMRDVFANIPDTILPLMSRNNRLDCIDFIENGVEARVKNFFDDSVVLESLTTDYLRLTTSGKGQTEMKLVPCGTDTLVVVNRIFRGPVEDSQVTIYTMSWQQAGCLPRPAVKEFLRSPEEIECYGQWAADTLRMIRGEAEYLPLIKATLSSDSDEVVWTLQTAEFSNPLKQAGHRYLKPVARNLPQSCIVTR